MLPYILILLLLLTDELVDILDLLNLFLPVLLPLPQFLPQSLLVVMVGLRVGELLIDLSYLLIDFPQFLRSLFQLIIFFLRFNLIIRLPCTLRPKTILIPVVSQSISIVTRTCQLGVLNNSLQLLFSQANQHILWFQVSMDNPADPVEEVQSH